MYTDNQVISDMLLCGKPEKSLWGAGIILIDSRANCILLGMRTDTRTWCTPGGHIETGETPFIGIQRETKEEVNIEIHDATCYGITYNQTSEGIFTCFQFVSFIDSFSQTQMRAQPNEMADLRWVAINDVLNYDLYPVAKDSFLYLIENRPDLVYSKYTNVTKLTATEQKLLIKNPGSNGGNVDLSGNYQKDKKSNQVNQPNKDISEVSVSQVKASFIEYFKNNEVEKTYEIRDGKFYYPPYSEVRGTDTIHSYEEYYKKFKEQYMLFALTERVIDSHPQ